MKKLGAKYSLKSQLLVTGFGLLINLSTALATGGMDAGGGTGVVSEFNRMARHFAKTVDNQGGLQSLNLPAGGLLKFVKSLKIIPTDRPFCEGATRDACSSPSKVTTELDVQSFGRLTLFKKYQLVVHEILVLTRAPDQGYEVSEELAARTYPGVMDAVQSDSRDQVANEFFPSKDGKNVVTTNFDGSVTISNPHVFFEGQLRPIATGSQINNRSLHYNDLSSSTVSKESALGLCFNFGFKKVVRVNSVESSKLTGLMLKPNGKFKALTPKPGYLEKSAVSENFGTLERTVFLIKSVTCENKL